MKPTSSRQWRPALVSLEAGRRDVSPLVIATLALAVILVTAYGIWAISRPPNLETGPARPRPLSAVFISYPVGTEFTDGWATLTIAGGKNARVRDVRINGGQNVFEPIGPYMAAGAERRLNFIQLLNGFPPRDPRLGPLVPLVGAEIPPGNLGLEVLIGFRVKADEFAVRNSISIRYEVEGKLYEVEVPYRLVYCPSSMTTVQCREKFESSGAWLD